jgi:hypothetical protein
MHQRAEDQSYFQTRVEQELAMARKAPHPEAAKAHKVLARLYLERIGANIPAELS